MHALLSSVLAIDASTDGCSVALSFSGQLFQQHSLQAKSHAQNLLPMVSQCLDDAKLSLQSLDAVAVTLGPGSFTGVRIGLSVAQGLAFGAGLPLIGKNTLEVMAVAVLSENAGLTVVPCLDARMGEVYWAAYGMSNGEVVERALPAVCSPEHFNLSLAELTGERYGVGHGFAVEGVTHEGLNHCNATVLPHARDILLCLSDNDIQAAKNAERHYAIEPLYLRNEVAWEKRTRIRQQTPDTSGPKS